MVKILGILISIRSIFFMFVIFLKNFINCFHALQPHGLAKLKNIIIRENNQNMDVFYWNESLDEELRKLVESCEFNFALIALSLKESCKQGCFGTLQTYVAEEIDADVCRKRFGYLESIGSHQ